MPSPAASPLPWANGSGVRTAPGAWLSRFADVAFSEHAREHVFRPIIADMQHEYFTAVRARRVDAAWAVCRGHADFLSSVAIYVVTRPYRLFSRERHMEPNASTTVNPWTLTIALGVLAAVVMVGSERWFTSGSHILIPYAMIVVGIGVVLRSTRVMSYRERFRIALGAFMFASIALYLYVVLIEIPRIEHHSVPLGLFGHAWRLGVLLAIGAVFSAPIAVVSAVPSGRAEALSAP